MHRYDPAKEVYGKKNSDLYRKERYLRSFKKLMPITNSNSA